MLYTLTLKLEAVRSFEALEHLPTTWCKEPQKKCHIFLHITQAEIKHRMLYLLN